MKSRSIFTFIIILILMSCILILMSCQSNYELMENEPYKYKNKLDAYVEEKMEKVNVPGFSLGIIRNNEIIYKKGYGRADLDNNIKVTGDTLFHLGSVSKLITATALMKLYEDGFIGLDDDINDYINFQIKNPYFPEDKITPRMLLTHSSSLIDDEELYESLYTIESGGGDTDISLFEYLKNCLSPSGKWYSEKYFLKIKPGTQNEYSNIGFALAGYLVEVITREPFNIYCNNNIFSPLKMENTRWFLYELDMAKIAVPYEYEEGNFIPYPYYGFPSYPDGQLKSSVNELLCFMQFFLNNGKVDGVQILKEKTIQEMLKIQDPKIDYGQAIGWSYSEFNLPLFNNCFLPAKGGEDPGAGAVVVIDPVSKSGFVILVNKTLDDFWTEQKAISFDLVNKLKNDLNMKNMNNTKWYHYRSIYQ